MELIISVIVPLYNSELYIGRCLDSIKAQTLTDFECVVIDDGSTDKSYQICEQYVHSDARFRLIHKENGGLSSARNRGLKESKGEYIAFVDSDDFIAADFLETLYRGICDYDADIAQVGVLKFRDEKTIKVHCNKDRFEILDSETSLERLIPPNNLDYLPVWNKLYRRSMFAKICFAEKKLYEDMYINYLLYYSSKRIAVCPAKKYFYFRHADCICENNPLYASDDYANAILDRMLFYTKNMSTSGLYLHNKIYTEQLVSYMIAERKKNGYYEKAIALYLKFNAVQFYEGLLYRFVNGWRKKGEEVR